VKLDTVAEQPSKDLEIEMPVHRSPPPEGISVLVADRPHGTDNLDFDRDAGLLAELVTHAGADTPFTLGVFGRSGTGKSFFLEKLSSRVEQLAGETAKLAGKTPFLSRIVVAHIDVAATPHSVPAAIAEGVYETLLNSGRGATSYAECAEEAAHATSDPHTAAREAAERLDGLRQRLDGERQTLRELEGRRAKLIDAVLHEAPGSQVDAYARANRARIEQRLKIFGFAAGEPIENYKDLIRDIAEFSPTLPSARTLLGAMWSYPRQFRLLVSAFFLALLGFGVGLAGTYRGEWIPRLWPNDTLAQIGVYLESHYEWFQWISFALYGLALICLALNIWRAVRFAKPVLAGVSLLQADVAQRRADLDSQQAHQSRRVDSLSAEAERVAQRAEDAERRARAVGDRSQKTTNIFAGGETPEIAARKFLAAVADLIQGGTNPSGPANRPQRLVVALDNFDALPAREAAAALISAYACLAHSGIVTVAALDRDRLERGLAELGGGPEWLEKLLQIPFDIAVASDINKMSADLMGRLIGDSPPNTVGAPVQATASRLDEPWSETDRALLRALAPLAGASVRSTKRFANLARLGRAQMAGAAEGPAHFASLAVALALDTGGTKDEIEGFERALDQADLDAAPEITADIPRVSAALNAGRQHAGTPLTSGDLRRGRDFVKRYTLRPQSTA
jgi:hypothetical protein